jgi:general secretion pathway protein A
MYESYWGLSVRPFDDRSDPAFYYPAEGHQAALVRMRYIFERAGAAAALVGPSGSGKTLLLETIERQLSARQCVFVRVSFPLLTTGELMSYLADRIAEKGPGPGELQPTNVSLRQIEIGLQWLADQDKRLVVIIDDAHTIEVPQVLDAIRLLLNLETPTIPGPSLLISGQTRLMQTLARTPALDDRILAKCSIRGLSLDETAGYLAHRIQAAGRSAEIFDGSAIEAVHALAGGIPRRINRLCDLALLVGFVNGRESIAAGQIETIADELAFATVPGSEVAESEAQAVIDSL